MMRARIDRAAKGALLALGLITIAGCAALGAREPDRYFVLSAAPPAVDSEAGVLASQASARAPQTASRTRLVVVPANTASFYDSQSMVYSRTPSTRAFYQFSHWTEPPGRSLDRALQRRLYASGRFLAVSSATDSVRGDLSLNVRIDEIYHDANVSPGMAKIAVRALLTDSSRRDVVARRQFTCDAPAATYDAPGAAAAMDVALSCVVDDIVGWTAHVVDGR